MKIFLISVSVLLGIVVIWSIGQYIYLKKIETLAYEVLDKKDGYEIRQYPDHIVAKTQVEGGSMNNGFGIVAGYIFGGNTKNNVSEKIAMTTPVITQNEGEDIAMTTPVITKNENIAMTAPVITENNGNVKNISFVMPDKYDIDTLPIPKDSRVELEKVKGKKWAVLRYTWTQSEKLKKKNLEKLITMLDRDGIVHKDEVQFAFYNPPLTLPFLLRNEVWVLVE